MNRANWDTYLGRVMSGAMLEGVFQIASMPEVITQEQGTTFEVVFPGENLDVEDLDNYSLIEIQVPDGMNAAGVTAFNEYFADKEVGDFFTYFGTGQYDLIENIGFGLVIDSFGAQFLEDPEEEPEIFSTWADVAAAAGEYFNDPLPELGDDRVFSYTYEFGGAATDVILEDYVFLTDKANANCVTLTYNYKPADAEDIVDGFVAKLEELGWVEGSGDLQGIFTLTVEDVCIGEIIIDGASETGLSYYYMAEKPAPAADFNAVKTVYEGRVAGRVDKLGWTSALVDVDPAGATYELNYANEDVYKTNYGIGMYYYMFYIGFENPLDADAQQTLVENYLTALVGNGFVAKRNTGFDVDSLYNETTGEFLLNYGFNTDGDLFTIRVLAIDDATAAKYITDIPAGVAFADALATFNAAVDEAWKAITGDDHAHASALACLADLTFDALFAVDTSSATAAAGAYATYGLMIPITVDVLLGENELQSSYYEILAALYDAGFVDADSYYGEGLWNAETLEFVRIAVKAEDQITLTFYVVDEKGATDYIEVDVTPAEPALEFETFAALKEAFNARVNETLEIVGFESALPGLTGPATFELDVNDETQYAEDGEFCYWMYFTFAEDVDEAHEELYTGLYAELLEQSGFVTKYLSDWEMNVLYNPETNEVVLGYGFVDATTFEVDVIVLTAEAAAAYITDAE